MSSDPILDYFRARYLFLLACLMQDRGEIDRQAEAMNDTWAAMSEEERLDLLRRLQSHGGHERENGMNRAFDYQHAITDARLAFDQPSLAILDDWAGFLVGMAGNVTSQNGEDGIIAALFDRIGARNRWCFEVGAADGVYISNTWALRQDGWASLLIEGNPVLFARLAVARPARSVLVQEMIGTGRLDTLLHVAKAPIALDLGVIDVDGIDAAVWRGLVHFRPRVVLIEFNPSGDGIQGGTTQWQGGLSTVQEVGQQKGYRLVARTYHNAFFVEETVITGYCLRKHPVPTM